jgi:hypothetical protein
MPHESPPGNTIARYAPGFSCSLLLHALALALAAGWLTGRPTGRQQARPRPRQGVVIAFAVAPAEDARFPGLKPIDATRNGWMDVGDLPSELAAGDFTFDPAKIAERAHVLFPFLTPGLAWEHFAPARERTTGGSLENPFSAERLRKRDLPESRAFTADDAALQQLLDRSWSRRDRWSAFQSIRQVAETHSGTVGRLPTLLQRYCDQNSLQPFTDTAVRDPRLWAQLGVAADHVDFIGFIRRYAADHPSTRGTTALLFMLDTMAQGSVDALKTLLDSDPAEDLLWTRKASPRAYELLTRLKRHYRAELDRRGLRSLESITEFHDSVRLSILTGIVQTTPDGYRASDARFLIGAIHWRHGRVGSALRAWRGMTVDPEDSHVKAYSEILRLLEKANGQSDPDGGRGVDSPLYRDIRQVLKNEQGRWLMFSYDRLRQFGYTFDTF